MNISPELSNLIFVTENSILGDVPHAIILSLIDEFHQIWKTIPNLRHSMELSQYFAVDRISTKYTNCEIVLKYENAVCISESDFNLNKQKYYFVKNDKINFNIPKIKYGTIEFYIKKSNGYQIDYTKISVVRLTDTIDNSQTNWNNESIEQIKKNTDISICRGQTDTLNSIGNTGDFSIKSLSNSNHVDSIEKIPEIISLVNEIIDESKKASINMQINQLHHSQNKHQRNTPSRKIINLGNSIANIATIEKAPSMVVLVPNFKSVVLSGQDIYASKCASILIDVTISIISTAQITLFEKLNSDIHIRKITPTLSILISSNDTKNKIPEPELINTKITDCTVYQSNNTFIINKIKSVK